MPNQAVKVKREALVPCMTCPLCHKMYRDATTIIECLHTFCRKCIYKKLTEEETECCPVCNIHLGCVPLEKLRPDHNLQYMRAKIFPYKRIKVNSPEFVPPISLPAKRKERSLSSLVINTPKVSTQNGITRKRSKSKRASKSSIFTDDELVEKEEDFDHSESSSSRENLKKTTQNKRRRNSAAAESSDRLSAEKGKENGSENLEGKIDLWKPLTCLLKAASWNKSSKSITREVVTKSEVKDSRTKEHWSKSKIQESEAPKILRSTRQKKSRNFGEFKVPPQVVLDVSGAKFDRKKYPIWFSLVASDEQDKDAPLPQISTSYLRIKDGNMPVSFIQKYLKVKLDLTSEDEVEITCLGHAVLPTLTLNNLFDLWLESTSSERVSTTIGSSAKDFVMVLRYARKNRLSS